MATEQETQETAVTQQAEDVETKRGGAKAKATKPAPVSKKPRKPAKKSAKKHSKNAGEKPAKQAANAGKQKPGGRKQQAPGQDAASLDKATPDKATQDKGDGSGKPKPKHGNPFVQVRKTIKAHLPKIVNTMVEMAEGGSCTHAKTILEISGAKRMFDGEHQSKEKGEPWAKLVLQKLDEAEQEPAAEAETAVAGGKGNA